MSAIVSEIMPGGAPDFSIIRQAPSIAQLIKLPEVGYAKMQAVIGALIANFCKSQNLPDGKNMREPQIIDTAAFLLDECGTFRIEDYAMMFTLAKRGKLAMERNRTMTGRVFDRVDMQLIAEFKENYEEMRWQYAERAMEEEAKLKAHGKVVDEREPHSDDGGEQWAKAMEHWEAIKQQWQKEKQEKFEQEAQERKQRQEDILNWHKSHAPGYDGPVFVPEHLNKIIPSMNPKLGEEGAEQG